VVESEISLELSPKMKTSIRLMIALLLASLPLFSQTESASITGRVTDPSGSAIVGANISVTNVDTRNADVVIAVVGLTARLEGEESGTVLPGFFAGDRVDLNLPPPQQQLLSAVAAMGKPLILVLTNGSALAVNWAQQHASAILEAWYPGEEGGTAVADVLSGSHNPSRRLPVTFYKSTAQLPPFTDYSMRRTYRYFTEQPLYPFGYGLSYTTFRYDEVKVSSPEIFSRYTRFCVGSCHQYRRESRR
jgi:hypothetical protein